MESPSQPLSLFFVWFFVAGMFSSFCMWLLFAQMTMRRIEKQMKEDGLPDSFIWDGVGGRIVFYACALGFPEKIAYRIDKRLIDARLVRSYSSPGDRICAILFLLLMSCWILGTFVAVLLGEVELRF